MEQPEPRRPPTVADIARRVGVSTAAVSYALNGRSGVGAQTRHRIRAAAEEMGGCRIRRPALSGDAAWA